MWLALLVFGARVADLSCGVLAALSKTRGRTTLALALGVLEVTIWAGALAVLVRFFNPLLLLAFAAGHATGLVVRARLDSRFGGGVQLVSLVSPRRAAALAGELRRAGISISMLAESGPDGPNSVCFTLVPRRAAEAIAELARQVDPDVIVRMESVPSVVTAPTARRARWADAFPAAGTGRSPAPEAA